MTAILTPEQVALRNHGSLCSCGCSEKDWTLSDSHEALRADRDSWQATAEELDNKNVNKSLTQRHAMREAALRVKLAEARADLLALGEAMQKIAKPSGTYNRDHREAVQTALALDPARSYASLARALGVSRERIRQLAVENGAGYRHPRLLAKPCPICGTVFKPKYHKVKCCSRRCGDVLSGANRRRTVTLRCDECGKEFPRRPSEVTAARKKGYRHTWCGRPCQLRAMGRIHSLRARGARPDTLDAGAGDGL